MKQGQCIFICGLPQSGKTHWILHSLSYFQSLQKTANVFKPFDIGGQRKKNLEQKTDSELFLEHSNFHSAILNPYHFSQELPLFFASNFDGFQINLSRVDDCLTKIATLGSITLIEILGGIMHPLVEEVYLLEWVKEKTKKIIWLMDVEQEKFLWNFAELKILQEFFQVYVVLNNYKKNCDAFWLEYLWKMIDRQKNCFVLGLIPFVKNSKTMQPIVQKIYQTTGKLILH